MGMTAIYHITHIDNLPAILALGELLSDTMIRTLGLQAQCIAHGHIKQRRQQTPVSMAPGGMVSDYVPFYFCPRSPMLYAIHGGSVEGYPGGQGRVLHLVADAEAVEASGAQCVHTDGNAASQPRRFFAGTSQLETALSWDVIRSNSWGNTADDNDRKRRKQAEFLVWQHVPWSAVSRIGVIDDTIGREVAALLAGSAHRPQIETQRTWYYP